MVQDFVISLHAGVPKVASVVGHHSIKALLDTLKAPYVFHVIDRNRPERAALRDAGFATVPQMFTAEGLHIGDFSDARRNALEGLLTGLPRY